MCDAAADSLSPTKVDAAGVSGLFADDAATLFFVFLPLDPFAVWAVGRFGVTIVWVGLHPTADLAT